MTTTFNPAARDVTLLEPREQRDFLNGRWEIPAAIGDTVDDPNTGVARQQQTETSAESTERAVAAAAQLHHDGTWAESALGTRVALLDLLAEGLDARVDDLAYEDALASGSPISFARVMASSLGPRVRAARDQCLAVGDSSLLPAGGRHVLQLRRALGPAAILAPWNAPTFVGVAKTASALAAGCPVILKPSEWAPGGCQIVAEIVVNTVAQLGLPANVFQFVHGGATTGSRLTSDPRIRAICFTGGLRGGQAIAAAAAPHFTAVQLELGGHNPVVILPDADIEQTAAGLAEGMTKLNGTWCEGPGRILVPDELHDDLVDALTTELRSVQVGHCLDEESGLGPQAYAQQRIRLQDQIDQLVGAGGEAITTATLPDAGGWFFSPTVVVGLAAAESTHELFGPAVTVHRTGSVEEAVAAAHGPQTGLAGYVFGQDVDAALTVASRIIAGEVKVNGCKLDDLAAGAEQSFWNNAGVGGHGPTEMVRFFQGRRVVGVDDPSLAM
ncbi:phenylacetaldehyde dehydrogenase [Mycobacterium sp. Root265]|uniref:aldehyde dehydrogenase family protein n=1 Tax=Mycobacterium sp. Root265 TaxID=1736504 RepID=UPI00070E4F73|nr:aldehyde dehydrogenase [Mycobacterium sp. Root265]KRD06011.1 phenylacetaldehyde dehydrogenase [Mycobacterium sp. Root265]